MDTVNCEEMPSGNRLQHPAVGRHAKKSRRGCFNCKARKVKVSELNRFQGFFIFFILFPRSRVMYRKQALSD